jgi:small-conductance mechanosensitive channel/CRP-like cAMP-binding protein
VIQFMESVLSGQVWIVSAFFALAAILYVWVRAQRSAIRAHVGLFTLAIVIMLAARIAAYSGIGAAASALRDAGGFLGGMILISLLGIFLFGGLLPLARLRSPRILQDVTVCIGEVVWLLAMLETYGVNLAGIIATSAILTAVVGLSMQDTLGNVVSGLAVQLDQSIQVGDWVKVDDIAGRVAETRWRYTAIETRNWETVLIPNSMLSKAKVIVQGRRRGEPVQWRRWVWFNLDFRYAPSKVIEVVETAIRMAEIPRVAIEPKPNCVAMDFADSYTKYAVRYWLTDLQADDPTDSEVRSHLYSALQRAGMSLSIPAHAVFLTEETVQRKELKARHQLSDRVAALRSVRLFQKLPDEDVRGMAEQLVYAPFDRGDIMTRQGAEPHWLYIMIEGTADRFVENDIHESTRVATLQAGDVFGEWSLMTNSQRESTVIATSKVSCYRLPKDAFFTAIGANPQLRDEISSIIAQRRTELEAALQHLDEEARARRHVDNQSRVLEGLKRLFGV